MPARKLRGYAMVRRQTGTTDELAQTETGRLMNALRPGVIFFDSSSETFGL
jgi:hypothetical protein